MSINEEETKIDNRNIISPTLKDQLKESSEQIKDGISLLDYGALEYGNKFQPIDQSDLKRWLNDEPVIQLINLINQWRENEKKSFENEQERYEIESVYFNFMFRFSILTRMAKKDNVEMAEIFDHIRQFVLDQAEIFEKLIEENKVNKIANQDGIHSYNYGMIYKLDEDKLAILWKKYFDSKKIKWKDVLAAESIKILKLLPKAVESFDRLNKKDQPKKIGNIRKLFEPHTDS